MGGCIQLVINAELKGGPLKETTSEAVSYRGSTITTTPQCPTMQASTPGEAYTATATTFTFVSAMGVVQVFTKI